MHMGRYMRTGLAHTGVGQIRIWDRTVTKILNILFSQKVSLIICYPYKLLSLITLIFQENNTPYFLRKRTLFIDDNMKFK